MKTLITSHANADRDAFAAMLAARHLYPNAELLFPGTQESGLAKTYAALDKSRYGFIEAKKIDPDKYDKLVLVDTRQKSRVPHVAQLLTKPNLTIEIWDHHPPADDDISATCLRHVNTGSATSAICAELEKKGCSLSGEEATLLGMGVYGDTGSFRFSSTTKADFLAAAWLLEQGMDVTKINETSCHELTGAHIQALNSLLESSKTYLINNVPVVLAEVRLPNYLGDFAYLAHQLLEAEKIKVLFAIGLMGDSIQVVARSLTDQVNVGAVCTALGGGGHAYAASASVRNKMITEVRETILRSLDEQINPPKTARDYMSAPAIGIGMDESLRKADELMLHFGLKAVPIFYPGTRKCAGLLDAQTAARATGHGLGEEPIAEYMQRRVFTLKPDAPLKEFVNIIVGARQRLVPIVEEDAVVGVVTRTDLINVFANEANGLSLIQKKEPKLRSISKLVRDRLPQETRKILELAGRLGKELRLPVYAVGGFARDLLVGHPNHDIDLVAEGNGIALARALAKELGGRVREHEKFLTSVVIYHDKEGIERHIDVATARLEYYEYPAALPTVELSSIKMDLFRRDFSINALAIRLDCEPFGQLVDFFGSQQDIKDKLIRVLHTLSFVEDPTRCIRAVRFEQRYKFRIGPGTEKLLRNILPMHLLEKLSPQRLFNEFKHLCEEENGAECIIRLDDLGILKTLGAKLTLNPAKINLLKRVKKVLAWYKLLFFEEDAESWVSYFLALCHNLNYADAGENFMALGLPTARKNGILQNRECMRAVRPKLLTWQKSFDQGVAKISAFYDLLKNIPTPFLLYLMASVDNAGLEGNISRFITQWRREKADINGDDLKRLGLPPGPQYARLLNLALMAKLDGKAPNAKSQLALILKDVKNNQVQ